MKYKGRYEALEGDKAASASVVVFFLRTEKGTFSQQSACADLLNCPLGC